MTEKFTFECEQENDGRWLAEVIELPGVLAYGQSRNEAIANVTALALHVLADRIEHNEILTDLRDMEIALADYFAGRSINAEDAFNRLGL